MVLSNLGPCTASNVDTDAPIEEMVRSSLGIQLADDPRYMEDPVGQTPFRASSRVSMPKEVSSS